MAYDGIVTHYVIKDLNENVLSGKINKIYQISQNELLFNIRCKGKTQKLYISIHPMYARVHLTKNEYHIPNHPPMFCMLLRKHLEGGIITSIIQKNNDRIIIFNINHINEIGDKSEKQLIVEIMGKHSNMVLIDKESGKILDSLKRISPFLNSYRTIQPGADYIYPPTTNKVNPFEFTISNDIANININSPKEIVNYFEGISPLLAKEIYLKSPKQDFATISNTLINILNNLDELINPTMQTNDNKEIFYLFPITHFGGSIKHYDSINTLLDRYYFDKDIRDRVKQQTNDLERFIRTELDRNRNKIANLENDLLNAENADYYRLCGELITANLYQITKGMNTVTVTNYYSNEEIKIDLSPVLNPNENAQKYYQKYHKAKNSISYINEQVRITNEEIKYFEALLSQMETANIKDALEIREELEHLGYLRKQPTKNKKKNAKPNYDTYITEENVEILVGKNNIQNEYITHKLAKRNEMWMHVKDIPGSHVVIRSEDELSENTIRTAANLAAYFSKARHSSSVPVDYTKIKNIKKIPGSKIGMVTYDNQKTIYIDPEEGFIFKLQKK